ncbi:MAG: hypothetical protein K8T91_00090 [Planctomycetes bacterium]|nr:hypothetical protein [Planctomycetota bacterium]
MNCDKPFRIGLILLAAVYFLVCPGCWRSETSTPNPPISRDTPVVEESLDDIRSQIARVVHVENNKHHITSPEEFDAWRLKALIKLDQIRRLEGVEGFQQTPVEKTGSQQGVVDATSKKIAWRASTCWNPTCLGKGKGGGPLVFVKQFENASIGPDGNVKWRTLKDDELPSALACPVCGLVEFVRPYDEPEVEIRRKKLTEELSESRRIRAEAEAAGQLVPAGVRTPTEIMKESTQLPKLFLVPDGG